MSPQNVEDIVVRVRDALQQNELGRAIQVLESLRSPDQADVVEKLGDAQQIVLLSGLRPGVSSDIVEEMDDDVAAAVISNLPAKRAALVLDRMDPDEAADVLGDVSPTQALELLQQMVDASEVRPLLEHPDDTAGGLITSSFLALRPRMTIGMAVEAIRSWRPDAEMGYQLFVVDENRKLCGGVDVTQLLTADPAVFIRDVMEPDVMSVFIDTDQEEVARLMSRYDLVAMPVVDAENRLLGVINYDDVSDVLYMEAAEDIERLGAAQPLGQPYLRASIFDVAGKRIGWLLLLFVTGSLTANVMQMFENEMRTVVALTFFVPLLIGTGGNAGAQTTSMMIRSLALGEVGISDAWKAMHHELGISLLLALGVAGAGYIRAVTWGYDASLALTVAMAIGAIVIWANAFGAILPLLATRLKVDPTLVSGPVMSTLVDAAGLFIYFSIARLILRL
ncbi:MAG: magnesium transporter [Anaerolineales bacterium]|nr:magnesium transporter [Anaerolineales bacterium]